MTSKNPFVAALFGFMLALSGWSLTGAAAVAAGACSGSGVAAFDELNYVIHEAADGDPGDEIDGATTSPDGSAVCPVQLTPEVLRDETVEDIRQLAEDNGLIPYGNSERRIKWFGHPYRWFDPATNQEVLRLDPPHPMNPVSRARVPHVHGYAPGTPGGRNNLNRGPRIGDPDCNGDPHFPLRNPPPSPAPASCSPGGSESSSSFDPGAISFDRPLLRSGEQFTVFAPRQLDASYDLHINLGDGSPEIIVPIAAGTDCVVTAVVHDFSPLTGDPRAVLPERLSPSPIPAVAAVVLPAPPLPHPVPVGVVPPLQAVPVYAYACQLGFATEGAGVPWSSRIDRHQAIEEQPQRGCPV